MFAEDILKTTSIFAVHAADATGRPDLMARILNALKIERMAEIGVWKGNFAAQMLRDVPSLTDYHLIDPWRQLDDWDKPLNETPDFEAVFQQAMQVTDFAVQKRHVHRGTMLEVVDSLPNHSLQACYIDGDHTLRGVLIDLISMYDKVEVGGVIFGDDLAKNPWQHGPDYEPTMVFPAAVHFAEAKGDPFITLPGGQFAILKSTERAFSFTDTVGGYHRHGLKAHFQHGARQLARRAAAR